MYSPTIYISGCHAGPNPSPGIGTARSLRLAFPGARLIAKDHSVQSSGIHDPVFDDLWISRPWNELDLETHRDQIVRRLSQGGLYMSGLDLEVRWLAENPPAGALVPPLDALRGTLKPEFPAARRLPIRIPDWISGSESPQALHAFCRAHNWRVWVKGAAYEAIRAENWTEVQRAIERLEETWGSSEIHLQEDIRGWEVSIVFCARGGRLLGALFMEKRLLTETGKTWSGNLSEVTAEWLTALRSLVDELDWTGGSELEFVRDANGELWLMDWNPRFPAWIHGATLAGRNLPALVIEAASGVHALPSFSRSWQFTRIVTEIPVRDGFPLPAPPPVKLDRVKGGKHPSGMPLMMRRLTERTEGPIDSDTRPPRPEPVGVSERAGGGSGGDTGAEVDRGVFGDDLRKILSDPLPTPYRAVLPGTASRRFQNMATLMERDPGNGPPIRVAYSCKTNPAPEFLRLARENGLWAEVISREELEWVLANRFDAASIVYNGPVPLSAGDLRAGRGLRALFADSVESFRRSVGFPSVETLGARLRPPFVDSRFGIDVENFEEFAALKGALDTLPGGRSFGLSFHIQSSRIGAARWRSLLPGIVEQAVAFQELTGRDVDLLDLGGGHDAADVDACFAPEFTGIVEGLRRRLPELEAVVLEPGKALVEPCGALVATVLELRRRGGGRREAVVDASVAEIPLVNLFPHRVLVVSGDRVEFLGAGGDAVLGRLCMESDILMPNAAFPSWLREGDRMVFLDCGAYDASMAYSFGKGYSCERPPSFVH